MRWLSLQPRWSWEWNLQVTGVMTGDAQGRVCFFCPNCFLDPPSSTTVYPTSAAWCTYSFYFPISRPIFSE